MAIKGYILYKIYYKDIYDRDKNYLVYIGRTKQSLNSRLRGHFVSPKNQRILDIFQVSRIEYTIFNSAADMYLYEIYLINKYKPPLNRDDKASDELSVTLPDREWISHCCPLMAKWKKELTDHIGGISLVCKCGNKNNHLTLGKTGGYQVICEKCGNKTGTSRYIEDCIKNWKRINTIKNVRK